MKLGAMLVDDEAYILKNLQQVIPWEDMGIEIVGLAHNGVQAMEMAAATHPDLILCDIRMPVMDGIEFLRKLRESNEDAEVIMLTGYQDFEYVRSVIRFNVRDYILKPIDYEELESIIQRLAGKIQKKKNEALHNEKKWGKVLHLAYEKILNEVLLDFPTDHARFLHSANMNIEDWQFAVLLVEMNNYAQESRSWDRKETKLWNFAVHNVLQEALLTLELDYVVLRIREGEWCVIVQRSKDRGGFAAEEIKAWPELLIRAVENNVKRQINVGLFPETIRMEELSQTYKKLQRMMHLAEEAEKPIIVYEQGRQEQKGSNHSLWDLTDAIVSGIKEWNRSKMAEALEKLNMELKSFPEHSFARVEQVLHFLILHLMWEMRTIDILTVEEEDAVWQRLDQCVDIKDLMTVVNHFVDLCMESTSGKKSSELMMLAGKDYIERRLSSDIGVEEVADYLGISSSYFSLLFKQHFQETFVEYLTKKRMEMAKSLLLLSDKSIARIGQMVGYAERRYFTKVFLKYTGEIPSEYREKNKERAN